MDGGLFTTPVRDVHGSDSLLLCHHQSGRKQLSTYHTCRRTADAAVPEIVIVLVRALTAGGGG